VYRRGFRNGEEPLDAAGKMAWAVKALVACFHVYRCEAKPSTEELKLWYEVCKFCEDHCCFPIDLLDWARVHHTSAEERGMVPHSIAAFYNALLGPKVSPTNGLMAQYKQCYASPCPKCVRARRAMEKELVG
jgi:hypothetical protein